MKAAIITGGDMPEFGQVRAILNEAEMIICVDGAVAWAQENGIGFDALIGDMDSITDTAMQAAQQSDAEIIELNPMKDDTDTEAACNLAQEQGASEITIIGGTGKRIDHTISNIHTLVKMAKAGILCTMEGKMERVLSLEQEVVLEGEGILFSLLPMSEEVIVEYEKGVRYPLSMKRVLPFEMPGLCISNVTTEERAQIKIHSGTAVLLINRYAD